MSFQWKVLVSMLKKSMFALILISISIQIANGQQLDLNLNRNSIHDFDLVSSNLPNLADQASGNAPAQKWLRLPQNVTPVMYHLKMIPNLSGSFDFLGQVYIELKVESPTNYVILNSDQLNISSVQLFRNRRKVDSNYTVSPDEPILTIQTKQKMFRSSDIAVNITFSGILTDEMIGFYRSSYKVGNTTKWLAITQFEPTYARKAFPCFDEPAYRAPFLISVARYPYQKAMSNMPLNKTSDIDLSIGKRVWDTFQITPPLPTYLVAFGVSEFNYRTNAAEKVRVWARENAMNETAYPLTQGTSALRHMEEFVGVPYSLLKLDIVAVPDFRAGAMENWGLTTYRERLSLFNPRLGNERNKEIVTAVIVHEFAHQWFGDLVTVAWWDYLWLNEGFATYFEYTTTHMVEPSWGMDELSVVESFHYALGIDGISIHESMNAKVSLPDDIKAKFNGISYDKAGSVIRMMDHVLSRSTFKKALQLYLKSRRNSIAEPTHLYEAIEEQLEIEGRSFPSNLTFTKFIKTFVEQPGYPCILVSRQRDFDYSNITIKQVTYKSPRSSQNVTDKTWVVPLTCTKQSQADFNSTQPMMWLVDQNKMVMPKAVRKDEWFICNIQQSGYYRVNYDEENWELLIKELHSSHSKIHHLNRAHLINDACTFARDGLLPHRVMFDLLHYLAHDTHPIPWYTGLIEINHLIGHHSDSKASGELVRFAKHIVGHFYSHVGFYEKPEDTNLMKIVRSYLLFSACDLEIEDAVAKAQSEFSSKSADLSQIPAYMKEAVLCNAIKTNSDTPVWNKLWDLFRNSSYDNEKVTVLSAAGCAKNQTLLKKYIHKLHDKEDHDIRKQDEVYVFRSITRFSRGITAVINYVHDILPHAENCTHGQKRVKRLLSVITGKVRSAEQIHRLEHVIEEAEKLNQTKIGEIKEKLIKIKEEATKLKTRIDLEAEKIFAALTGTEPKPKPSAAAILIPHALILMFTILSVFKLNI